ncbi:MAG: TrkH family potassium uptake protein [Rubrivivax sp.]
MGPLAVVALIGRMVLLFALLMGVPLAFALAARDPAEEAFLTAAGLTVLCGALMSVATRRFRRELRPREGFLLVGLTWLVLPAFGALPLLLALPGLSLTDAYFEAMSAFTATGATVLTGLDELPLSVNVWRCFMMFVGGLGIIVLAVAILPLLGVGGSQLFKAEITGPMKDQKLTPRIADTARMIWVAYVGLGLACMLAYRWAGMSWIDAFLHMCSTVSLGGFSSHDLSFGYWNSPRIEAVAIVFMVLSGVNLVLYVMVWQRRSLAPLWRNVEVRAFYVLLALSTALITVFLVAQGAYEDWLQALRHTAFHVVSVATTTGFASHDYGQWPLFAPMWMILLGCLATCAGSTGGGIKMVRLLILLAQARREMARILHPRAVNPVVLSGRPVSDATVQAVLAFMITYGATIVGLTMLLLMSGLEPITAFTAVVACVNNIGPGLGEVGPAANFASLSDFQTWVCSLAMLLGRLELLSVLVLLTPGFWRR